MTDKIRKSIQYLLTVFFAFALVLGLTVSANPKTAKAATVSVTFSSAVFDGAGDFHPTYGKPIRLNTTGLQWQTNHNWVSAKDWKSIADYTTINGRTITEINDANPYSQPITLMMQPAGTSFSFLRIFIPEEIMDTSDVYSVGISSGWSFNNGTNNYTSNSAVFVRSGSSLVTPSGTAESATIGDGTVELDQYRVNIDLGIDILGTLVASEADMYAPMRDQYAEIRDYILINGESINSLNARLIEEDSKYATPSTYKVFPQSSTQADHIPIFCKPVVLWATNSGFQLNIFKELVDEMGELQITVGAGLTCFNRYVNDTVSKDMWTGIDLFEKFTFTNQGLDTTTNTNVYLLSTGENYWSATPHVTTGILNENDYKGNASVGGQRPMAYIYFNDRSIYDINSEDDGTYGSTQVSIKNGGLYAPIVVYMSYTKDGGYGSYIQIQVPTKYPQTSLTADSGNHNKITLKKGFVLDFGNIRYYVSNDLTFENNGGNWSKKLLETETEVTGIVTMANRTDGGNNENFVIFQLSKNDYNGLNTTAINDISSLYGYIDIGGNIINSYNGEKFFNVWGIQNSVAFRFADATTLQNVKYITIKAGAKFPSHSGKNYFTTNEDVTFIHNVPNDVWELGYNVTFQVGDETQTERVKSGATVTEPTAPTKAEDANYTYTFNYWTLNGVKYDFSTPVTQNITLVANFTKTEKSKTFSGDLVTIDNPRVEGVANELYKVDITSSEWTITCNKYDFMYGGNFAEYRKYIFINGVSVYDINANTDDSSYKYSTFPMTGHNESETTFAHPILIETHVQEGVGDPTKITLWMHKDYLNSLGDEIVLTLGKGYNAFTGEKTLDKDVEYNMVASVTIDDGTTETAHKIIKGSTVDKPKSPLQSREGSTFYVFDNWYATDTNTAYNFSSAIVDDLIIEARFTATSTELSVEETEVTQIFYNISETNSEDRWLIFCLFENDYGENFGQKLIESKNYHKILASMGTFDRITIKGEMKIAGKTRTEATLSEILKENGYGEEMFLNIWNIHYKNTFAMRVIGVSYISEIVIEKGCVFPSYQTVFGSGKVCYETAERMTYYLSHDEQHKGDNPLIPMTEEAKIDIKMARGASIRITSNMDTTGIRFTTLIAKSEIEKLQAKLGSGEYKDVVFGTLIVPTDYIMGGVFTHDWLNCSGYKYLDITSTAKLLGKEDEEYRDQNHVYSEDSNYYCYYGSIVKLKESNFDREFSAVGYILITLSNGESFYVYASANGENSRSAAFVAGAAINDRSANKVAGKYDNLITSDGNYSPYTEGEHGILKTYLGIDIGSLIPKSYFELKQGASDYQEITVNQKIDPYVQLLYSTDVNVWGVFEYQNKDGSIKAVEDFYLEANTSEHTQFLDIFRTNGVGAELKKDNLYLDNLYLTSIKLKNAEPEIGKNGDITVYGFYVYDKIIGDKKEIYLTVEQEDGSEMTVGAHLGLGGALTYLAKSGIYEGVVDQDENNGFNQNVLGYTKYKANTGKVVLKTENTGWDDNHATGNKTTEYSSYGHGTSSKAEDGAVNLINNYDAGRQIQQSWYAEVGEENEYSRAFCKTESEEGKYWPYNPVQAGDVVSNPSQIIDYAVTGSYIYVKSRAMDWAKGQGSDKLEGTVDGGVTTKSYTENYYRLNADGTLVVTNRFIDWNGFTDMGNCAWASTELPAIYPVHTLNYYVTNASGDGTWADNNLTFKSDMSSWVGEEDKVWHQYNDPLKTGVKTMVEEWFAWANGGDVNAFGMGVYIPNVYQLTSGRSVVETSLSNSANSNALNNILSAKGLMSNMQEIVLSYKSAYVSNTSYTAPGVLFRMEEFVPIEFNYVICLDTVSNIRAKFKAIKDSGKVTNAGEEGAYQKVGLDAWARSDKRWTW